MSDPASTACTPALPTIDSDFGVEARLNELFDKRCETALEEFGFALLPGLLSRPQCQELSARYDDLAAFRKTVVMARHGLGRGEYRYFRKPLPPLVQGLRGSLYRRLAPLADRFCEQLRSRDRFPAELDRWVARSRGAGQCLPTPLLLRYGPGDYNCLHQDLYGEVSFPLQVACLLDEPHVDFTGGEFVLVEQRPRMQSRPVVVPLGRGDAVVFPCNERPRRGTRGFHRATMRHGVSEIRSGRRHALGLIFHDATA